MIRVRVRFFAMIREITGVEDLWLELPEPATATVFWEQLTNRYPELQPYRHQSRLAVNQEYASGDLLLRDGDEVGIIPPVSGG